jgi:hypothetical protein
MGEKHWCTERYMQLCKLTYQELTMYVLRGHRHLRHCHHHHQQQHFQY